MFISPLLFNFTSLTAPPFLSHTLLVLSHFQFPFLYLIFFFGTYSFYVLSFPFEALCIWLVRFGITSCIQIRRFALYYLSTYSAFNLTLYPS